MAKKPTKRASSPKTAKPPSPKRVSAKALPAPARADNISKLDSVIAALRTSKGVTIPDLMQLTGWQAHSVRGVLSGALKKQRGFTIASKKTDGARVYRIETRK